MAKFDRQTLELRAERFVPVENYAVHPFVDAFEDVKGTLFPQLRAHEGMESFDTTLFYSRRNELSSQEEDDLMRQNEKAYAGAISVGGLVVYVQGKLIEVAPGHPSGDTLGLPFTPNCMSLCIWETRRKALQASALKDHRDAVKPAREWFSGFAVKKLAIYLPLSSEKPSDMVISPYET